MKILGIETSCDETAVAIIDDSRCIHANLVFSQLEAHRPFGGVVPEIAARAHMQRLDAMLEQALQESGLGLADLDGIAVTAGPGLIGGVIVGVMSAKALASVAGKKLVAVNHLEGHALTVRLTDDLPFPYLLLLVSGGHCQLLLVQGVGTYRLLGQTLDDAAGEAFDKTAKLLGLGYPGGPAVEKAAKEGNPQSYDFTMPLARREGCDFSFSGLKTAVRRIAEEEIAPLPPRERPERVADLCASFQRMVGDVLADRVQRAAAMAREVEPHLARLVVAGGVAANRALRQRLEAAAKEEGLSFHAPPSALCTDNAAMIAWAGLERLRLGLDDPLTAEPRARWSLTEL